MVFQGVTDRHGRIVPDFPDQAHALVRRRFPAGTCIDYEVREQRSRRSDRQNRAFHALIATWARERGWSPDHLKEAVKGLVFGHVEVTLPLTGEMRQELAKPHTSRLTVTEFCHLIEETLRLAAEDDVFLDAPDEYRKAKEAAAKRKAA